MNLVISMAAVGLALILGVHPLQSIYQVHTICIFVPYIITNAETDSTFHYPDILTSLFQDVLRIVANFIHIFGYLSSELAIIQKTPTLGFYTSLFLIFNKQRMLRLPRTMCMWRTVMLSMNLEMSLKRLYILVCTDETFNYTFMY